MKKILVSLPDDMHTLLSGRDVSMSELIRAALVQYLDLDPLTFEPRVRPTDTPAAECKRTEPRPEPKLPTNLDDIDFAALDDEYPRGKVPPFDSLPFMEQRRIMDEFTAERNKTHPDQYCYGVVDTPAGYLPQYADMDPAD